jgi:polysaccharide biosynthesis transport protein
MQLSQVLSLLARRKWVIAVTLGVCLLLTVLITFLIPPAYRTEAVIRVLTPGGNNSGGYVSTQYVDRLTATYLEVLQSPIVLTLLRDRLGLASIEDLPDIEFEAVSGTELLIITVYDADPMIANELGTLLVENPYLLFGDREPAIESLRVRRDESELLLEDLRQQYEDLFQSANPNRNTADTLRQQITLEERSYEELNRQYTQAITQLAEQTSAITLVQPAEVPERPYRPVIPLNLAIGIAAGLIGGLGLAFLFENLDNALYTVQQIENVAGSRIIGQIPRGKRARGAVLRLDEGAILEGFRSLRVNILSDSAGYHTVLVTSSGSREGKSSVAGNLAVAIAQANRRVLLIDANLRQPVLHEMFSGNNTTGLSEVLTGSANLDDSLQQLGGLDLFLLSAGTAVGQATDLLSSERMRAILRQASRQYDIVVIDTPAATDYADAIAIAPMVDGVIAVVERANTRDQDLRDLLNSLDNVNAPLAGIVVNRADQRARASVERTRTSTVEPVANDPTVIVRPTDLPTTAPETSSPTNGSSRRQRQRVAATDDL